MKTAITITTLAIILTGCAAGSTTKVAPGQQRLSAHAEPVCLLKSPIPSDIAHTLIGEVHGRKKFYGGMDGILAAMGNEARSIGADAVVNVKTRYAVGALAWARPIGQGTGIKLNNKADLDCLKLGGEFR